jgi:hypothetical protein
MIVNSILPMELVVKNLDFSWEHSASQYGFTTYNFQTKNS